MKGFGEGSGYWGLGSGLGAGGMGTLVAGSSLASVPQTSTPKAIEPDTVEGIRLDEAASDAARKVAVPTGLEPVSSA